VADTFVANAVVDESVDLKKIVVRIDCKNLAGLETD